MSIPAREVRPAQPAPGRRPSQPRPSQPAPGPAPSRAAPEPHPKSLRPAARIRRRRHYAGFLVLSSVVIGMMVLALVSLSALLAQRSFRIDDLRERIGALSQEHVELLEEQASLSAPGRIAMWAYRHGMRLPDDIRSLHVPSVGSGAPAGDADILSPRELEAVMEALR